MLSYQHAYHAGNPADVHKHVALVLLLERLGAKDKPYSFVDCHAGRGVYDLTSEEARKTGEAAHGIVRLLDAVRAPEASPPPAIRRYVEAVRTLSPEGAPMSGYPGSPALARSLMRGGDRGLLLELHPAEHAALRAAFDGDDRFAIHRRDCHEGLPALLPPAIRRGLVLIDPSYEVKSDYDSIPVLLDQALDRWANGIFLIWYPLLPANRHRAMLDGISAIAPPETLISEYRFGSGDAAGLRGSGLVIVNAPWQCDRDLSLEMAFVVAASIGSSAATHDIRRFV